MIIFHPLEVVGRGSETQLQVGENLYIRYFSVRRVNRISEERRFVRVASSAIGDPLCVVA